MHLAAVPVKHLLASVLDPSPITLGETCPLHLAVLT